jgi:hypothetical protein
MYLVGIFWDVLQINMGNGESCDVNIKLRGNGALDIHEDAYIIAYLQACEVLVELTTNECDYIMHWAQLFKGNSFL